MKKSWSAFLNGKMRRIILVLFDVFCFAAINAFYYWLCKVADGSPRYSDSAYIVDSILLMVGIFGFRLALQVNQNVWRYSNTLAYFIMVAADASGGLAAMFISRTIGYYHGIWHFVVVASLTDLVALVARFTYQVIYRRRNAMQSESNQRIRVAIVGAGQLGFLLANDLLGNVSAHYRPVLFIDRDEAKIGSRVAGLEVFGENVEVYEIIRKYGVQEVFIALTELDNERTSAIYEFYRPTGCKIKIYDLPLRDASAPGKYKASLRDVQIEDLLFRKPLTINNMAARYYYTGKTVLVTGGGGSIGSELCRQIAACRPERLVIFDIYENNAYDIQQELIRKYGDDLNLNVEIGSVRDRERLRAVCSHYRPQIVFHAAAHKHVPLMEHSSAEAIKNNVLGTYNTADMAEEFGTEKFILISTDKAVNPTNVMGASKRMCEMIVQCRVDSKTSFAAVRFGNVLGSNGSVIPLFRRQIESGGPVTITDKRIIRYFMTIPEASQLVMHAGAMAKKGELFVLDMGKPVRIYDLAVNMIRLSGLEPGRDIEIQEIGLRPGEKLYEELLIKTEDLETTENKMIFVERDKPLPRVEVDRRVDILTEAVRKTEGEIASPLIKEAMAEVVPTFHDPDEVNRIAEEAEEMLQTDPAKPVLMRISKKRSS
ncbi:MAG: polysaccharide biosynthesis protein [Clostridia bacterium]|nr:polysaccharide biosynthesis protein [Clostridia bacterium]